MPRQQNGNFLRYNNRNYEYDNKPDIDAEITGKILNDDIEDLRVGIEDCLDGKARSKVQENIDFGGKKITNLGNAKDLNDAVNLQDLLLRPVLEDNGSNEEQAEVKLIIDLDIKFKKGFTFSFVAPFTQTKANIKANKRREIFTLKSLSDEITLPVLREVYDTGIFAEIDYKPSFLKGDTYKYFIDEYKGELYVRWEDPFRLPTVQIHLGLFNAGANPKDPNFTKDCPITPVGFYLCETNKSWTPSPTSPEPKSVSFIGILRNIFSLNRFGSHYLEPFSNFYNIPRVFIRY